MTTDAHPPRSRITEALLPQTPPAPGTSAAPAPSRSAAPSVPGTSAQAPSPNRSAQAPAPGAPAPAGAARPATAAPDAPVPPRPAGPPAAGGDARGPLPGDRGRGIPPRPAEAPSVETTARLRPIRDTGRDPRTAPANGSVPAPRRAGHPLTAPATGDPRRPAPPRGPHTDPAHGDRAGSRPETGTEAAAQATWAAAAGRSRQAYGTYGAYQAYTVPPETPAETTTRLRPVQERRTGRLIAAGVCLVVGLGLTGGAVAGTVLAAGHVGEPPEPPGFSQARALWHNAPVDTLFPRTLAGPKAGPGDAARSWTRVVVAPDAPCTPAVLPASVLTALRPPGCDRVLRATYTDATATSVITVGLAFTPADPATMRSLDGPLIGDDAPPPLSAPGTVAERFGAGQRASWWTRALPDLPVVVFSVSGFADGRPVSPEPAAEAMAADRTTAPAQAGLGHEAKGVADGIERGLRATVAAAAQKDDDR
ncbi:hypothetical protein ACWGIN_24405 [Streptomyces sp. NPDC054861]